MKEFTRTDAYMTKIFLDAFEKHVVQDAVAEVVSGSQHLKVWCEKTNSYLQFPSALRTFRGRRFICDVVKASNGGSVFYRAYRGSIRDGATGELLA